MVEDSPKKKNGSKLWKHLRKLAEYAAPVLLPLLLSGKSTVRKSFKKWSPKGGKGS
jgi:hypothetical protein